MKYPVLILCFIIDSKTQKECLSPAVFDLDLNKIVRFYKSEDGFTYIKYIDQDGYYKLGVRFWEFLEKIKEYNNLNLELEELVKMYDKDSPDDLLLNGI